jgi:hypothetical protein
MTPAEAAALLTIAAAYDNRKPDEDQARAWALVLTDLRFEDCRDAIVIHYRHSRDWLMPADVVKGAQKLRIERWDNYYSHFGMPPYPPELADDPAAENRWYDTVRQHILNGTVTHPDQWQHVAPELVGPTPELKSRDIASLGLIGQRVPRA